MGVKKHEQAYITPQPRQAASPGSSGGSGPLGRASAAMSSSSNGPIRQVAAAPGRSAAEAHGDSTE